MSKAVHVAVHDLTRLAGSKYGSSTVTGRIRKTSSEIATDNEMQAFFALSQPGLALH